MTKLSAFSKTFSQAASQVANPADTSKAPTRFETPEKSQATHTISLRVTDEEKRRLARDSVGMSRSAYMRETAAQKQAQQLAQTQNRAKAEQQKRTNTIKELRDDFNALEASKEAERQRAKEAFKRERKSRTTHPKRRSRARDAPGLER